MRKSKPSTPLASEMKEWRQSLKLTQAGAAEWLGVPLRTYQEWEQSRRDPAHIGPIRKLMSCAKKVGGHGRT